MDTLFLNTPSASVSPGTIILLLPDEITKYILKYGYFKYNSEVSQLGWYLIKISDSSLLPVTDDMIPNIKPYVTDNSTSVCDCDKTVRPPKPAAFTDKLKNQTVRSFITVDTIADRDALLTLDSGIVDGKIVRVNRATAKGESRYYRYDSINQEWLPEQFNTRDIINIDVTENIQPASSYEEVKDCSEKLQTIINKINNQRTAIFFPAGHYTFKEIDIPISLMIIGEPGTVFDVPYREGIPTGKYVDGTIISTVYTEPEILSSHYTMFKCNAESQQYVAESDLTEPIQHSGVKLTIDGIEFNGHSPVYVNKDTQSHHSDPIIHFRQADLNLKDVKFQGIYQISAKDDQIGEYMNFPNLIRNIDGSVHFNNILIDDCIGKELMWIPAPTKFYDCSFECHNIDMSRWTGSINSYCKDCNLSDVYLHDVIYSGSSFNLFCDYVNIDKADADNSVLDQADFYPYFKYPAKGSIDTYEAGLWSCQSVNATNLGDNIAFYFLADVANVSGGYSTTTFGLYIDDYNFLKHRKFPKKLDITFSNCYYAYHGSIEGGVVEASPIIKRTTEYVIDNNIIPRIKYHNCKTRLNSNMNKIEVSAYYDQCDIIPWSPCPEFIPREFNTASKFELLSAQPSDWTTNFSNYYTYSVGSTLVTSKYVGLTQSQTWEANKFYKRIQVDPTNTTKDEWNYSFKTRNWQYWRLESGNTYTLWWIDQAGLFGTALNVIFSQCRFDSKYDDYLASKSTQLIQCSSDSTLYLVPIKSRFVTLNNCHNIKFWDTSTGLKSADADGAAAQYNLSTLLTINYDKISYGTIDGGYTGVFNTYNQNDLIPKSEATPIEDSKVSEIFNSVYRSIISRKTYLPGISGGVK